MKARLCVLLIFASLLPLNAQINVQLYLSPTGDDTGNCTNANPCKTINGIQSKLTNGLGATVTLEDGLYNLSASDGSGPIRLTRSGASAASPILYKADNGARPVLSGLKRIQNWNTSRT